MREMCRKADSSFQDIPGSTNTLGTDPRLEAGTSFLTDGDEAEVFSGLNFS